MRHLRLGFQSGVSRQRHYRQTSFEASILAHQYTSRRSEDDDVILLRGRNHCLQGVDARPMYAVACIGPK
jgi:hypothetical protein